MDDPVAIQGAIQVAIHDVRESRFRSIQSILVRIARESRATFESPPEAIHFSATIQLNRVESWSNRDSGMSESRPESWIESQPNRG